MSTQTYTLTQDARPGDTGEQALKKGQNITMRELYAEDLIVSDGVDGEASKSIKLVAHMTGLTEKEVGRLRIGDFAALAARTRGF
jgi:hypothetical protein